MRVLRLNVSDWRNYASAEVVFEPGANVLAGSNGQGKTNLVEAIGYLSTLGSHRVSTDAPLIRTGSDAAIVRALVAHGDREVLAEVQINRSGPNRAQLGRAAARPRAITEAVSSVLFAPEDLSVVRGDPAGRRRYLDELLVARTPRMAGVLGDYDRALRQRNGLLKSARNARSVDEAALDAWDERLIATGTEVVEARAALVAELEPFVAEQYGVVAGAEQTVTLTTVSSIDGEGPRGDGAVSERFAAALLAVRRREIERGITLVGPHRDDLAIALNELPARVTASHGESWSLALALRLGAVELLRRDAPNGDPVVILDDVFAELDERRRSRLAVQVARYEQVIITAAVEGDVPPALAGSITRIRAGEVVAT